MRSSLILLPLAFLAACTDGDDPSDLPEDGYVTMDGTGTVAAVYNAASASMPSGPTGAFTLRARFQSFSGFASNNLIAMTDQAGNTHAGIFVESNGAQSMSFPQLGLYYTTTTVMEVDEAWHVLAMTWDPAAAASTAKATLWLDGTPVISDLAFNVAGTDGWAGLPADGGIVAGASFTGGLDDVQVFASALTVGDLGNTDVPPAGAVLTWDMDVEELVTQKTVPNTGSGTGLDGQASGGVLVGGDIGGGGGGCVSGCNPGI